MLVLIILLVVLAVALLVVLSSSVGVVFWPGEGGERGIILVYDVIVDGGGYSVFDVVWLGDRIMEFYAASPREIRGLLLYSCRIRAGGMSIVVRGEVGGTLGKRVFNVTLVLRDGVARCMPGVDRLPPCEGCEWRTIKQRLCGVTNTSCNGTIEVRTAKFDTLNLTTTIVVYERGFAYTPDGRPLGHFVFMLPVRRDALLLYSLIPRVYLREYGCGAADMIFVHWVNESVAVVEPVTHPGIGLRGIPLLTRVAGNVTPEEMRGILDRLREWENLPPFIRHYIYYEENDTLVILPVNTSLLEKLYLGDGEIDVIREVEGSDCSTAISETYVLRLGGGCYWLWVNADILNATYIDGLLHEIAIDADGILLIHLGEVLPSFISLSLGVTSTSSVKGDMLVIRLVNVTRR